VDGFALDRQGLLRAYCLGRLAVVALGVALGAWMPAVWVPTTGRALLLAVVALVVATSGLLLSLARPRRSRGVARLLCALDAALITAAVAATGGARSMLVCLYVLLGVSACLLLSRWGALTIALMSSGLYAALLVARTVIPAVAFDEPVDRSAALDMLAIPMTSGTIVLVSVVAGTLGERYLRSQRQLGDLQAFSDVIFRSVSTGLVTLDRDHRITALNPAAEAMTGRTAVTAVGTAWTDVFGVRPPLDDVDGPPTAPVRRDVDLRRSDGTTVSLRITASPLEVDGRRRLGSVAACEDLSSIRAMEARMRQADRLATLGRMAANIAHEVRNPLAGLSGAVETLVSADVTGPARTRLTEIVVRESERLSDIIETFLDYASPPPLVVERIDAAVVLDEVVSALSAQARSSGVKIVPLLPASLPLDADRERFRQTVWTMCASALAAMPSGGELRLEARRRAGMVEVTVSDTGEGIAAEDLPHVFEPFFAARRDADGLGLALVHRIVQEHGGEVTLRSEGRLGVEVVVRWPACHD
jgi:two-component system, NtrC family, sensor histidine kinase PilS